MPSDTREKLKKIETHEQFGISVSNDCLETFVLQCSNAVNVRSL